MTTLARLSLWGPPDRLADLAAEYDKRLSPCLAALGLIAAQKSVDRPAAPGVFNQLFALESPAQILPLQTALRHDDAWHGHLAALGLKFPPSQRDRGPLEYQFGLYSTPSGPGQSLDLAAGSRRGDWRTFSVADGLPSPTVHDLAADAQGRLWISTNDGLVCMEGAQLRFFTVDDGLSSKGIGQLLIDRQGRLWGTTGQGDGQPGLGLVQYDPQAHTWMAYTRADGVPADTIRVLRKDATGLIWVAGQGKIVRYNGESWTPWAEQDRVPFTGLSDLLADQRGRVWLCARRMSAAEKGLICFEGTESRLLGPAEGLQDEEITRLFEDSQGRVWAAGRHRLHYTPDPDKIAFEALSWGACWPRGLVEDLEGRVWAATYPHGLACCDGQEVRPISTTQGLPDTGVQALVVDRDDRLWCGMAGGGVSVYEEPWCRVFTQEDGLDTTSIFGLYEAHDGRLWIGTLTAVSCWDGQTFTNYKIKPGEWDNAALVFYETDQGELWMVNYRGWVKRFTGEGDEGWVDLIEGEGPGRYGPNFARSIVRADDGQVWLATGGDRAYRYDGEQFHPVRRADGLVEDEIRCILKDGQGRLWFGGAAGGLCVLDDTGFTTIDAGLDLGQVAIQAMLEDDQGRLWIATNGAGVVCYDGDQFKHFTKRNGLLYDRTTALCQDNRGHVWIGTLGAGISRFDGLVFQALTLADGLPNGVIVDILQDREGAVWLATEEGLVRYKSQDRPPQVGLVQIMADRAYAPEDGLALSQRQGVVRFEFQGRAFGTRADGLVYVYRLQGRETDWQTSL
ncbi:MAG: hypothetical protein GKR89_33000 [Candidatus Latescibacteria bacterium]|nr:hypothetical protein [Candidatus Latescibacterota bacterium]